MTATITTTAAATEANVTVDTVRAWCRRGVVAATKAAGRWVIDAASLAHRITIGQLKARKNRKPAALTVENMVAIGGNEWIRGDYHRVYFNETEWYAFARVEITRYNTGNISSFSIGGRGVANGRAGKILGTVSKVYFDVTDGKLYVKHYGARAVEVRYLNGDRDVLDLVAMISAGVRKAVAAL